MREPEQIARSAIDDLLRAASWQVCGVADANIHGASGVAIREFPLPGHGSCQSAKDGRPRSFERSETRERRNTATPRNIVRIVREEFGKGNASPQAIARSGIYAAANVERLGLL